MQTSVGHGPASPTLFSYGVRGSITADAESPDTDEGLKRIRPVRWGEGWRDKGGGSVHPGVNDRVRSVSACVRVRPGSVWHVASDVRIPNAKRL